jgi:hypothetical protein
MLNLTAVEVREFLAEAHRRGLSRITREDVIAAAQYSDTSLDLKAYLKSWDHDMRIEQECDDKAAAWFERASY